MIAELKKLLAQCHVVQGENRTIDLIMAADYSYLLQRSKEELALATAVAESKIEPEEKEDKLEKFEQHAKLLIQLVNMARYKLQCTLSSPKQLPDQKPKSKKRS